MEKFLKEQYETPVSEEIRMELATVIAVSGGGGEGGSEEDW